MLQTMAKAKRGGDMEDLQVAYKFYELGILGNRPAGGEPPALRGLASVDLSDATAAKAASALTSGSKDNFFIDPWDEGLAKAKVTLKADKEPLAAVAKDMGERLTAERCRYDGAWLFVRTARKPMFEGLMVRVYNVARSEGRSFIADEMERRVKEIKLPENLPYSVERVGDRMLASAGRDTHRMLERYMHMVTGGRMPGWPGRMGPPGRP
jgi:hypothetical protein